MAVYKDWGGTIEVSRLTLPIERYHVQRWVSNKALQGIPSPILYMQDAVDNMQLELSMRIATQHLDMIEEKYPADWWQAVKERFAPRWFLVRYPVNYKHFRLEAKALYPKLAIPEHAPVVEFARANWSDLEI